MSYGYLSNPHGLTEIYPAEAFGVLKKDGRKIAGCFATIRQQDGNRVRMDYPEKSWYAVKWMGIHEQMAGKFL